jgi:hypothetical protein
MTLLEKAQAQMRQWEEEQARIVATLESLHSLGVLKPGEQSRQIHMRECPFNEGGCSCPGGPELVFADWNEQIPPAYIPTPERFYAR